MTTPEPSDQRERRILILAPTGRDGELTARFLREAALAALVCGSVEDLCSKMDEGVGLILLAGEALTAEAIQCLKAALRQQPAWSDVPIIVLTSGGGGTPANAEALAALGEAGNVTLIERPVRVQTLLSGVRAALRARQRQYDVRGHLAAEQRAKEELEQAILRAVEASRLKDEFLATVSHELRTPLTAVLGWTHLLLSNKLDESGRTHALEIIERNARSQQQLVEDLLDVSRIITGKLRLDVRPVEPSAFIDAAVEAVRPAAEAKGVRIQKVGDAGVNSLSGDPVRLQQVVWNLLSNAIKFTPKGGLVRIRLERVDSHVEITVADDGEGIDAEFLPYVFERFRQADMKTTRVHGGLGLGLAIVRQLVELHGGTVGVTSPGAGSGATFVVKLPLMPVYQNPPGQEGARPQTADACAPAEYTDDLSGVKVLAVDDEADTCELLRSLLTQCGAEVTTARSAAEALDLLTRVKPDVMISDVGMPGEDGYELMRKVRALPAERGGGIPAVALTAYARGEDRLMALRAGYQMHVAKPIVVAELVAIVASLVARLKG
jgi:signal transduction histidine kinase/ActR/RegA family two-component response regulator